MIVSFSTVYFFIYLLLFVSIGLTSSLFIVPLLGASFAFASGVVIFGFLSNVTFKSAQTIYIKVDKRLKFILAKMSSFTNGNESEKNVDVPLLQQTKKRHSQIQSKLKNSFNTNINNNNLTNNDNIVTSTTRGIDVPLDTNNSVTSAIARSLETRADSKIATN
ncbi:hypothetical protein Kpol_1032p70 [Vanderwaltozyma polyspora DSM 70294]|uniref:Outer spore wall protein 5 n=1 Tax=Vanderwaltozyma polyspora (strain ATCC 22028 / DSM 70294 / BCRC 21397 / CBS 2163 / NBRC 10782 / NRRL Y-8283 / UCD 57-17) TaxID=436907 RepID=OSW5_VANPO|nr:uncharacterized protein Kpol_1032p70 [Vanderwaltozyma polyspora DSM 70294]A7TH22.1 RecName: Full=Outer spore wall protein 5 [Vanderwaltozyma polyspora DSM 70294]EDO18474.1 hypothetical protein Kpol_1032p70 [Vanderwaltozyma polyspora DSM 70294]